jgi:hypothetical protein
MDPNRPSDRILREWDAVASTARQPETAPRRRGLSGLPSLAGLVGAGLVAAALIVAVGWLGGRIAPSVGGVGSAAPTSSTGASPAPSNAAPTSSTGATTADPACDPGGLAARITAWEGAAGSRIADVTVTNRSATACLLAGAPVPELVDGSGRTIVRGTAQAARPAVRIKPGDSVTTLVNVSNVCGAPPAPPVTVAFDLGEAEPLRATPLSPTDTTVPPCNGPGLPAQIEMQEWSK